MVTPGYNNPPMSSSQNNIQALNNPSSMPQPQLGNSMQNMNANSIPFQQNPPQNLSLSYQGNQVM